MHFPPGASLRFASERSSIHLWLFLSLLLSPWYESTREPVPEYLSDAGHPRLATVFSGLVFGYNTLLAFLQEREQITKQEADTMRDRATAVFPDMCRRQSEKVEGEKPTRLFVAQLREMLETNRVKLRG